MTETTETQIEQLVQVIGEALLEKKAEQIIKIDVRGLSTITDYFIVCHASSDTQIKALANNVVKKTAEELDDKPVRKEGLQTKRWVTLDYADVMVHIFLEELRNYYQIEKMWMDAPTAIISDD